MDLSTDAAPLSTRTAQEPSPSAAGCQRESSGTILLQLMEFKSRLLEAVEELHIRRDAETRFEDQISKLVLEKQELEWETESLQHQTETTANQQEETLINVRRQFQAKIRSCEEEKARQQVGAELKDMEISLLKDELKSLQLLKYNLEKKTGELEQKLGLQIRSKDSHLDQLVEVEKHFRALSRQCAAVRLAHENLEQNVDEALKRNKKLTSVNEQQQASLVSLRKELDEVDHKLIRAKMSSAGCEKTSNPTGRDQRVQQLQQKLNMETEMNKKIWDDIMAVRAEKQEVVVSLQQTQQLLLTQTQTVSRVELELQTQREQNRALKREHEEMREKGKAAEDALARLTESYSASRSSWDKEKAMLLERVKTEQQEVECVKEAYEELHKKHADVSSMAGVQTRHVYDLETRGSRQRLAASTQIFTALVDEIRGQETLIERISGSEPPSSGSLQHLASSQTKEPDCLEEAGAASKPAATGATGGSETPNPQELSESKLSHSFTSLSGHSGRTDSSDSNISNKHTNTSNTGESGPDVISHLDSSEPDKRLQVSRASCVRGTSATHSLCLSSVKGSSDVPTTDKGDEGTGEKESGSEENAEGGEMCGEETERNDEKQRDGEDGRGEAKTTDGPDREDGQWSAEDSKQETGAERGRAHGSEERGIAGPLSPETQILVQRAADTTAEESNTQQVTDFMQSERPVAAEPSGVPPSLSQKVNHKQNEEIGSVQHQSVSGGSNAVGHEVQRLGSDEDSHLFEKTIEKKQSNTLVAAATTEPFAPLSQSSFSSSSQAAAEPVQSDDITSKKEVETTASQSQLINPDKTSDMMQAEDLFSTHVREDCVLEGTNNSDDDSSGGKKSEGQSNVDTRENDASQTPQQPLGRCHLTYASADMRRDTTHLQSGLDETGSCQEDVIDNEDPEDPEDSETANSGADFKPSLLLREADVLPGTCSRTCQQPSAAKRMLLEDMNEPSPLSNKYHQSSFDWSSTQRQAASVSEKIATSPGGLPRHPSSTIPTFLRSKQKKVPLVITRASDLLNVSRASGTAASSWRRWQGERESLGGAGRETASRNEENRASPSMSFFPGSTSSITVDKLSWQTTSGTGRAPTSAAGSGSEPDWDLTSSLEKEDQQASFRAQISKIEQFLNTERLRQPKKRRTEN